jgi:hypothetical protein
MLAGHGKSSIRAGHAPLRGGGNSGDLLEKSHCPSQQGNCTRHTQTWHVEGGRRACFNNRPSPDLPVAQSHLSPPKVRPNTSRLRITSPTAYKKTCPSRSKERHSCQLVTCTSTRQASSSATSFQLPPSETKNTHPPESGQIDASAYWRSADCYLHATPARASLQGNIHASTVPLSRLPRLVHKNPLTSLAAQPGGPQLRLPCLCLSQNRQVFFDV